MSLNRARADGNEVGLNETAAEALSLVALTTVLLFAVARPRGLPEAYAAVPAAAILIGVGAVTPAEAWSQLLELLPVVGFLAAILVLSQLCADEGLFAAAGDLMARAARGDAVRLLGSVFVVAALTTAVLSLDATVVLLTPVVFATTVRVGARPRPHVFATAHLANSASLLLPVSNLTNLLAFSATGLSFPHFALLMGPAWMAVVGLEYLAFRWYFRGDLRSTPAPTPPQQRSRVPAFAVVVLAVTLAGFVVSSFVGLDAGWVAAAGAAVLAIRARARRRATAASIVAAANLPFCLFVLALGVVVAAVVRNGLAEGAAAVLPTGTTLPALLAVAAIAAVLANVINNLPAILVLLPILAAGGPGPVLAALIGVNLGPNLTYVGSLATLLWRRIAHEHQHEPGLADYTRLGLVTVPVTLVVATVCMWAMLLTLGG